MFSLERVWRGLLALAIVGTIPLSIWGSGCGSQPLVQPDAGGQSGGAPGTGGVSSGGSPGSGGLPGSGGRFTGGAIGTGGNETPRDASVDALSACCSQAEANAEECTPDGQQLKICNYHFSSSDTKQCAGGSIGSYAYIWLVQDCPNGCATGSGTGGAPGTGGTSGLGGTFGAGGSVGTGGIVSHAYCQ